MASVTDALARAARPGTTRLEILGEVEGPGSVGLVPGSFDPMTIAHAAIADALRAEVVLLVYSPSTLPKELGPGGPPGAPLLGPETRVASLLAWCEGRRGVEVALASGGLLADQAEAATLAFPGAEILFGIGSDKVMQLFDPRWYRDREAELARLFDRARVAYAVREGEEEALRAVLAANPRLATRLELMPLPPEVAGVSSRTVREALRRGDDVTALIPPEILPFIEGGG